MFINITHSETASNKGSSGELVHYLEKENRFDKQAAPERWFSHSAADIQPYLVRHAIDNNIAKLGRNEAKFFLVNISPSEREILHLKNLYGEDGAKEQLKLYAQAVMGEYARNFKRSGIESGKDLVWFGKLENHRYYSHHDREVKQKLRKRGELKDGEQMHVQVIVSRKDATNRIKLSPMNNSRGSNEEHSLKVGQFDRSEFKSRSEKAFDLQFAFDRELMETYRYANIQKKGSVEERMALHIEKLMQKRPGRKSSVEKPQEQFIDRVHGHRIR